MSGHNSQGHAGEHHGGSTKWFMTVWIVLLVLTAIEVFLAYIHLPVGLMLTVLLGLSFVKAALIIAYFMHLRYDGAAFAWTLLPMWILCTLLLLVVFPDSFRIAEWGWPR
jgi:cytochrome c oxidase subunit 4